MTEEELHEFGIQVILPYIKEEDVTIESVNTKLTVKPQIIGRRWDHPAYIFVRTVCYPGKASLSPAEAESAIKWADYHGAIAFFAAVEIVCSNYPDKSPVSDPSHHSLPIRYGGFFVYYEGLLMMTMSHRVQVLGDGEGLPKRANVGEFRERNRN
ncbi:MAG: hypothetical protein C4520_18055 [Candidatus Abyssobacteria bacterium SURF_5]|uniref:Uncharacterized protein n=1 Tax=Abyssobacteria bacterium (strain SURF_5) TaxID=2093360 RepID=A0A3A4N417_ABYX5|nr:MAG: hypothetical protein C4520_18055 [Candidatus Abyssubacteria bacterium SURF_5]